MVNNIVRILNIAEKKGEISLFEKNLIVDFVSIIKEYYKLIPNASQRNDRIFIM